MLEMFSRACLTLWVQPCGGLLLPRLKLIKTVSYLANEDICYLSPKANSNLCFKCISRGVSWICKRLRSGRCKRRYSAMLNRTLSIYMSFISDSISSTKTSSSVLLMPVNELIFATSQALYIHSFLIGAIESLPIPDMKDSNFYQIKSRRTNNSQEAYHIDPLSLLLTQRIYDVNSLQLQLPRNKHFESGMFKRHIAEGPMPMKSHSRLKRLSIFRRIFTFVEIIV